MKKYICCLIVLLCSFYIHAQSSKKLDSLKKVLAKLPPEGRSFAADTTRVRVLCEMGEGQNKVPNENILRLISNALKISKKNDFKKGILISNLALAKYYDSQPIKATEYLFKALVLSENLKSEVDILNVTELLGGNYFALNDYDKALVYYVKHSNLCKKRGVNEKFLLSLNNIAVMYILKKDYTNALKYLVICEESNKTVNSNKIKAITLINIAKIQIVSKKYKSAIQRLKKAIPIDDGYSDRIPYTTNEIAQIYLLKNDLPSALIYAKKAYYSLNNNNLTTAAFVNKTLFEIYKKMGRKEIAFDYLEKYNSIKLSEDSLKNSQLNRLMILDYQSVKQFQTIAELNQENLVQQNKSNLLLVGFCFAIVVIGISFFFYRSLSVKNKEIEIQKNDIQLLNNSLEKKVKERTKELSKANEELIVKNAEILTALVEGQTLERKRVGTELHDNLGSTLSALKWRFEALNKNNWSIKEQKIYEGILQTMHNAYSEVRLISHNMLPAELEEKGLIGAIQKLVEDINQGQTISIDFEAIGFDIINNKKIEIELYSICLELINNIIKHSQANHVIITLKTFQNTIFFSIKDNGKGIGSSNKNNGIGLKTIKERVKSINGEMQFDSEFEKGTEIKIEIPIHSLV